MAAAKTVPQVTLSSTKKELMEAYLAAKEASEKRLQEELKPEKVREEHRKAETIKTADTIAAEDVLSHINSLKSAIAKELGDLAEKLDVEANKYRKLQDAVGIKEDELRRIYEIDAAASALAALVESHRQKKLEYETEESEMVAAFERQKQEFQIAAKEEKDAFEKAGKRAKEEFEYNWKREQEQKRNALKDELAALEKQISQKEAAFEQAVAERETVLAQRDAELSEREKILSDLQSKVDAFPETLENAVAKAVKETASKLQSEFSMKEALLNKGFEGDRNVYEARINGLETTVTSQARQIEEISSRQEKAYEKVQDIAARAVAGAANRFTVPMQSGNAPEQK
ncbi:MAG: hypothetical protein WCI51_01215 [Lentisphaerota bacterium]